MEQPRSQFEGTACPHCGARLRVTNVEPSRSFLVGGGVFSYSTYECEGTAHHRFMEHTDRLPKPGATVNVYLRDDYDDEASEDGPGEG